MRALFEIRKFEARRYGIEGGRFQMRQMWSAFRGACLRIAAAWEVHKIACDMLLTREYLQAIQEQTRLEGGSLVEWPDVLVFLVHIFPEAICRAFLKANGIEYIEVLE